MNIRELFNSVDKWITAWLARYGIGLMRVALGTIFFWVGVLKFSPDPGEAEDLAARTIQAIRGCRVERFSELILTTKMRADAKP